MATLAQKEARIEVRTTSQRKAFIARGAKASGQNVSDFILSSAQEKAEMILADQTEFVLRKDRSILTSFDLSLYIEILHN